AGQTLAGNGTVLGSVLANPGATVSPGLSLGSLMITNVVTLQGTTFMELNASAHTNDTIKGAWSIVYGGTLWVTNVSGVLAAGDNFKLFYATHYSGAFTNIAPAIPGLGLGWNTNNLNTGTVSVLAAPTPQPRITQSDLVGNQFTFSGTDGVPGWTYFVLSSTNVALPISQWSTVATNRFDSTGGFMFVRVLDPNVPQTFYALKLSSN